MGTPLVATRRWSLKPPDALRLWTIVGLVGTIALFSYFQVTSIGFDPLVSGLALLAALIAAAVAIGWRWAPLFGALWSILVLAAFGPYLIYDLTHPAVFDHFPLRCLWGRSWAWRWSPASARPFSTSAAVFGLTLQVSSARARAGCWCSSEH